MAMYQVVVLFLGCATFPLAVQAETPVHFNREIRPLLSSRCVACHGPDEDERMADLRLDTPEGATADLGGYAALVPGAPELSELFLRITTEDTDQRMPPAGKGEPFRPDEIALIERWIEQGGEYQTHWSYTPPVQAELPEVANTAWPNNEIDQFLLARMEKESLPPSGDASRRVLARRVALDLTGLPPTPQELDAFLASDDPAAYERFVDAMLNRPAFGEHWARRWLDHARYADSSGYPSDQPRQIWGYRDWVINAFNRNLAFDQFTIEQLAGDLLPHPTEDQVIATAFHRNTMTQNEGGTSDEEFRVAAVIDRVNTTMEVWMGTTMACAQCHTHKFDPITQQEYFQLFAIFNQSADADRQDEAPLLEFFTEAQKQRRAVLESEIEQLEMRIADPLAQDAESLDAVATPVLTAVQVDPASRDAEQTANTRDRDPGTTEPPTQPQQQRLAELRQQLDAIKPAAVPVMRELPTSERRVTRIQRRGNWLDLAEEVQPNVPSAFHALANDPPVDRLALARWIADAENPLTARVAVNRFWESIFGVGIVQTSEDFGTQGEPPFHPELLDWLAVDFMDHGWDIKRLLKQFVTSRAYQQQSRSTPELNERDPDNRLLARGPRFRPSGEQLRDQALFVSGLLSPKMGGPAVRPLAPNLGLTTAFGRSNDWTTSDGEDRHRRSLYTEVRRNSPYASFATFDAPNRETCTIRRNRTNTPLQAFVTLNDPVFVEAHQALARRLVEELPDGTVAQRIARAFQLCLARDPNALEVATLEALYQESYATLAEDPDAASKLATEPIGPAAPERDLAELAAWTVTANVIMNLDEYLMRL